MDDLNPDTEKDIDEDVLLVLLSIMPLLYLVLYLCLRKELKNEVMIKKQSPSIGAKRKCEGTQDARGPGRSSKYARVAKISML